MISSPESHDHLASNQQADEPRPHFTATCEITKHRDSEDDVKFVTSVTGTGIIKREREREELSA